jgi:hypothetical protein
MFENICDNGCFLKYFLLENISKYFLLFFKNYFDINTYQNKLKIYKKTVCNAVP